MRRMIPGVLVEKIKNLFTSIWTDKEGDVEVGKNIEVDGSLKTNGDASIQEFYVGKDQTFDELKAQGLYASENNEDPNDTYSYLEIIGALEKNAAGVITAGSGIAFDESGVYHKQWNADNQAWDTEYLADYSYVDMKTKLYRHHLTITTAGGEDHQDYFSKTNLVVDSLQDLSTITGKHPFGSGENEYKFSSSSKIWEKCTASGTEAVTKVVDDVQLVTD